MKNIHETAIIENTSFHESVYIGPYCLIGLPAENRATWPETPFGVEIQDGAILCKLVTVDSGTIRNTVIGKRVMLMAHSHIGHDAIIGDDVTIACGAKIGGHAKIGEGANIGLNACIHPKVKVAPFTMIGMGAVVTKHLEIKPFSIIGGNPAKWIGFNNRGIEKAGLTREQVDGITKNWLYENS